ncbi:MAG: CdaR family protein [Thermodesulfovibrionales bacterium]|nr:CdaR family protein [Thermodesulfovibrionales bacterium]
MSKFHKFFDFFRKDLILKITSLFIAIVLWFFVVIKGQTEITMNVPLELKYIPRGLGVESKSVSQVTVGVKGFEQIIKNLKPYDVKVSVDLSKAKKGMNVIYLGSKDVSIPSSLTVTSIEPSSVRIRLDEIRVKRVSIIPELTGEPQRGYVISAVRVEPETVEIEGLRSHIEKMRYIKTEPLSIDGIKEDITFTALLEPPAGYVRINPESVKVKVIIRRQKP